MPIIEIRALPQDPPVEVPAVLGRVCQAVAQAAGCPERQVWATWQTIADGHYVEGTVEAERQPRDTHPPLARVMAFEGRSEKVIRAMLAATAAALAGSLAIDPESVFVQYEELRAGRVHAGGKILE